MEEVPSELVDMFVEELGVVDSLRLRSVSTRLSESVDVNRPLRRLTVARGSGGWLEARLSKGDETFTVFMTRNAERYVVDARTETPDYRLRLYDKKDVTIWHANHVTMAVRTTGSSFAVTVEEDTSRPKDGSYRYDRARSVVTTCTRSFRKKYKVGADTPVETRTYPVLNFRRPEGRSDMDVFEELWNGSAETWLPFLSLRSVRVEIFQVALLSPYKTIFTDGEKEITSYRDSEGTHTKYHISGSERSIIHEATLKISLSEGLMDRIVLRTDDGSLEYEDVTREVLYNRNPRHLPEEEGDPLYEFSIGSSTPIRISYDGLTIRIEVEWIDQNGEDVVDSIASHAEGSFSWSQSLLE